MRLSPLTLLLILVACCGSLLLFFLLQLNIIALAFRALGIPDWAVLLALLATLLGSFVNLPLTRIPQPRMVQHQVVTIFGRRYAIPLARRNETVLAVNLGGAVLPAFISLYLYLKTSAPGAMLLATGVMVLVAKRVARPVPGLGIAMPLFLPPLCAALLALLLAPAQAPLVAYVAGSMGTLIGADLLNLNKLGRLGAPVAAIGGAGTFDGIFISGILAVLLAVLVAG